jgi:hypothetical protein
MFFSFDHGFETDGTFLARKDREQRETNQRLHDSFRAESLARSDAELREYWTRIGLGGEKMEEWFREDHQRRGQ